jgi:hypothetical protein
MQCKKMFYLKFLPVPGKKMSKAHPSIPIHHEGERQDVTKGTIVIATM